MNKQSLRERIPGWGADLKPESRPGVPKEKVAPHGTGAHWTVPEQQPMDVKIFKTIARNEITPVFGNTCPPKGLSGRMRALAYGIGEDKISHWVTLLMADRVDMIESMVSELFKGRMPHPLSEMGLGVELQEFEKRHQLSASRGKKAALFLVVGSLGMAAMKFANDRSKSKLGTSGVKAA